MINLTFNTIEKSISDHQLIFTNFIWKNASILKVMSCRFPSNSILYIKDENHIIHKHTVAIIKMNIEIATGNLFSEI